MVSPNARMTASVSPPLNHHEKTPNGTGTASPFLINKTFSSGQLGVTNPTVTVPICHVE
ncbi:hypothetical protein HanRHA438_Chr03g0116351 [Helianthus annuus]|nr:hypothetical protein HanRHA438_Chr03g0116351 [Helianthus annuus]